MAKDELDIYKKAEELGVKKESLEIGMKKDAKGMEKMINDAHKFKFGKK